MGVNRSRGRWSIHGAVSYGTANAMCYTELRAQVKGPAESAADQARQSPIEAKTRAARILRQGLSFLTARIFRLKCYVMAWASNLRMWRVVSNVFDVDGDADDLADVPKVFGSLGFDSATGVFHANTLPFE